MLSGVLRFSISVLVAAFPAGTVAAQDLATQLDGFRCNICHGDDGTLEIIRGQSLVGRASDSTFSVREFINVVRNGTDAGMPAFPALQDGQLSALYDALNQQVAMPEPTPAPPAMPPQATPAPPPPAPSQPSGSSRPDGNTASDGPDAITMYCRDFADQLNLSARYIRSENFTGCAYYHRKCASCHGANLLGATIQYPVTNNQQPGRSPTRRFTLPNRPGGTIGRSSIPFRTPNLIATWRDRVVESSPFYRTHQRLFARTGYAFDNRQARHRPIWRYARNATVTGRNLYNHFCKSCHEQKRPLVSSSLINGNAPSAFETFKEKIRCDLHVPRGNTWGSYSEQRVHPCCTGPTKDGVRSIICPLPLDLLSAGMGVAYGRGAFRQSWNNDTYLKRIHKFLCEEGNKTCIEVAEQARLEATVRAIGHQATLEYLQRQAESAGVPNHSYYLALQPSRCKRAREIAQDGLTQIGNTIRKSCRMGRIRTSHVTRTTLAEALDPTQRPRDRRASGSSFGTGLISEPGEGNTGGPPNIDSGKIEVLVNHTQCIVPELFDRGTQISWTCGEGFFGKSGTIQCPSNTSFVKVTRARTEISFQCFSGPWDRFLANLREREGARE